MVEPTKKVGPEPIVKKIYVPLSMAENDMGFTGVAKKPTYRGGVI